MHPGTVHRWDFPIKSSFDNIFIISGIGTWAKESNVLTLHKHSPRGTNPVKLADIILGMELQLY